MTPDTLWRIQGKSDEVAGGQKRADASSIDCFRHKFPVADHDPGIFLCVGLLPGMTDSRVV